MPTVTVAAPVGASSVYGYFPARLVNRLQEEASVTACSLSETDTSPPTGVAPTDVVVLLPPVGEANPRMPAGHLTATALAKLPAGSSLKHLVVVSSAEAYGARPHNPGLIPEGQPISHGAENSISASWGRFEEQIESFTAETPGLTVTILRCAACLYPGGSTYYSRILSGGIVGTLAGHDPTMQLLHPDDLAQAIFLVVAGGKGGTYNVAPDGVIPLRPALRAARVTRLPTPRWCQRLFRWILPKKWISPADQLDYIRYTWTVSNGRIKQDLGFQPRYSSPETLRHYLAGYQAEAETESSKKPATREVTYDDLGLEKSYLDAYGRTLFRFLNDVYWRIECKGTENIPSEGRALLAGVHRGFMPLDGVMSMDLIVKSTGRYPRFLIHPTLIKFPFQFNFMTKIGGIIACQQNADYVLERDELVGFYPEGIQGAFRYIKGVYKLGRFGRNEFVRMALRNRAPIVPFVTVGNAEIFPIIGKIKWNWWKQFSLWPVFPIAPPFPLLPVPLPSKWHVQFLEPIHVEQEYPPEAADDRKIVKAISDDIRDRMQAAIDEMLSRRKHIFFGSIFKD